MKALEDQTAANLPGRRSTHAERPLRHARTALFQYKPNERWDESYQVLFDALYA